ncbi:MAG: glycosyltransferase family 4 protein [Bacteroidaceae bacterium]|nr:glycosyltransferase family 4 protein [Bacteroidaceae bacterium]
MNILISNDSYPTPLTPFAAWLEVLCKEFTRQGHDVTVIAPQSLTKHWLRGAPLNPSHYSVEVDTEWGMRTIEVYQPRTLTFGAGRFARLSLVGARWATQRILKRLHRHFDVYYAQFWASAYNFLGLTDAPVVVDCGEDEIRMHRWVRTDELAAVRSLVRRVFCVSSKNRDESVACGLSDGSNCVVLPNGIEQDKFFRMDASATKARLGIHSDDFTVAFVGRFIHRKGTARLVEALRRLDDSHIRLILIGAPDEREQEDIDYKYMAHVGPLAHDCIAEYLNCADVYVLPTLAEGCSNSIIEAMACGLPVISSDLPFNHDVLNADNSILIDPMDIDAIAHAIKRLKDDLPYRHHLAEGAKLTADTLTIQNRISKILTQTAFLVNN